MLIEVIAGILVLSLVGATAAAAVIGLLTLLTGERFARCARCHHFAISVQDQMHPSGCPTTVGQQLTHFVPHGPHS